MTPHYEDAGLRLWHGSNKDILPAFADASFDSIITDPPYELGFMGKGWDSSGIAFDVEVWRECLRVLKPGGHLLAFGGTRTWHRIAAAIEDAGFEIRDSIAWLYGSGFPKSMNVGVAIDKMLGNERGDVFADRQPVTSNEVYGKCLGVSKIASVPGSAESAMWEGWGTALKPAFEPIIVARKPLNGTVAANVLAYGTGALNVDATRVPTDDSLGGGSQTRGRTMNGGWDRPWMHDAEAVEASAARARAQVEKAESLGRFPANVLLDESQAAALDEQTGILTSGANPAVRGGDTDKRAVYGGFTGGRNEQSRRGTDSGGGSRFFPVFRYEAKAPSSERPEVNGTVHATVKPLGLMRWLVRLITRPGGRVLDVFAGSGTTGEAALLEGMEVDLIELEAAHLPLILQRVRKPLQPSMFGDWDGAA
ncbi:DNA-methyltransferase [Microbacterium sp. NPDC058389]|uniref:DNA-methyltransferase n=1 Tax=Microbacterium sp. NPDC058389 TaxID=3346475 RepID=UPI00365AEDF0